MDALTPVHSVAYTRCIGAQPAVPDEASTNFEPTHISRQVFHMQKYSPIQLI